MNFGIRDLRFGLALLLFLAAVCGPVSAQMDEMEISGFRVPEYDEKGQMLYQLFGEHAELGAGGAVKIDGVRVEFYRDGDVFMEVTSPDCLYDQKSRKVTSEAPVSAEMDGARLTGTGYLMDVEAQTVQVLTESRVVFREQLAPGAADRETVITSEKLFLDYAGRSARFTDAVQIDNQETTMTCDKLDVFFDENNELERAVAESSVVISSGEMTMECGELEAVFTEENELEQAFAKSSVVISSPEWTASGAQGTLMVLERKALLTGEVQARSPDVDLTCDTLNLRFNENNEIDWIEALTDVKLFHEGREAYAGRAVYDVTAGEFLLEDNPKLVDEKNMLMGDRIRFWRATNKMVCEPAHAVIFPDAELKKELFEN